ncbi:hypothetical protein [Mycobacterium persicum]|uniref:hypothetical protein n=1 Tax=Mycobacterium persicum TaxID=1487726 RepID=UPI0020D0FFEC|nr:hypothetical protein [Mycobacterium persicum]
MTNTVIVTIKEIGGEPMLDMQAIALLFGVEVTAVEALPIINGHIRIPREWARRGKRRAREAMAHNGSDFILDGIRYWARHDYGADLEVVYQ